MFQLKQKMLNFYSYTQERTTCVLLAIDSMKILTIYFKISLFFYYYGRWLVWCSHTLLASLSYSQYKHSSSRSLKMTEKLKATLFSSNRKYEIPSLKKVATLKKFQSSLPKYYEKILIIPRGIIKKPIHNLLSQKAMVIISFNYVKN